MIPEKTTCKECLHFGECTSSAQGRIVTRCTNEELREKFESQYREGESKEVYSLRKQKVELPFGHIKHNLGANGFLLRGAEGVKAEMSLLASCFNIARMITIIGVPALVERLMS